MKIPKHAFITFCAIALWTAPATWAFQGPLKGSQLFAALESGALLANTQEVHPLTSARVVLADYDLLRRDFAELRGLDLDEIDLWIVRRSAWMSKEQILFGSDRKIHEPIPHDPGLTIKLVRPFGYGRALLFPIYEQNKTVEESAFWDVKGVGSPDPQLKTHETGVADLREMLSEFAMEKLVHQAFLDSGEPYDTVETYAVLDLGFKIHKLNGEVLQAGAAIRQGHLRAWNGTNASIADLHDKRGKAAVRAEKLLHRYGLTGNAVDYFTYVAEARKQRCSGYQVRGCNIQGFFGDPKSNAVTLVDFGTYTALKTINLVDAEKYEDRDPCPVEERESYVFPAPIDPKKQVSVEIWGIDPVDPTDETKGIKDNLHLWSHRWATRFATEPFGEDWDAFDELRDELQRELNRMLVAEKEHWGDGDTAAIGVYY